MKEMLSSTTLNIYLIFLIILVGIVIIYICQNRKSRIENFNSTVTNTAPPIHSTDSNTTDSNTTDSNTPDSNPLQSNNEKFINLDNINIPDITTKNIVVQSLKDLKTGLQRFSNIDAPISINDDGNTCTTWGNYNNGKYRANDNNCIIVDNTNNIRKCLRANGGLATCNNLYSDGYIDRMNNIDTQPLMEQIQAEIIFNIGNSNLDLDSKSTAIDGFINDLVTKRNLENQQLYFINYNTDNLQEKQNNMDKINTDVSEKQTEVNLNQVSFSQFLATNSRNDNLNNIYYNVGIGLVISIVVVGILNVLFSNLL